MKRIFITVFLFQFLFCFGRNETLVSRHQIDSLQKLLPRLSLHEQVDLLNMLASELAPLNFDSSIMYSAQAVRIGSVYGYPKGVGLARFYTGNAYYYELDMKNALLSYLSALKIFEENHNQKEAGDVYLQLGHINFFIKRTEKCINYYHRALESYQAAGDEHAQANVYEAFSLALNNLNFQPRDSSLIYGQKLLNFSRKASDSYRESLALIIIGQIYLSGCITVEEKQKSLSYNDSALQLATQQNYPELIAVINLNNGCFYDKSEAFSETTHDLELARTWFEKALVYAEKISSNYLKSMILNSLTYIDIEEKKWDAAEKKLDESELNLGEYFGAEWKKNTLVITNFPFQKIMDFFLAQREKVTIYHARFQLATARGDYKKANEFLQLYYNSTDAMNSSQQTRQLELIMTEAEAEKTDQKIRMLSQQNELNALRLSRTRLTLISVAGLVVILSLFLLLFFQRKRWRAEQKSHDLEQKLLRSQMNPHFIFNSLASIQNFVINQKANEASIYLSRFAQLVRNILDSSVNENVPLEKETETIRNYLELQKIRYAGQFDYTLKVDENIDEETLMIPPMLAQPFIENSIEHGIKYKDTPGHIEIRFKQEGGLIRIEVEDDGVGRDKARKIESKQHRIHRSMSTSITYERLIRINQKLKNKIRMEIIDLKDSQGNARGTKVTFGIPVVMSV